MPTYDPVTLAAIADIVAGARVDRPAQLGSILFTTAKVPLFNVLGGRIKLLSLIAEVTVALGADATLAKFTGTPTVGTSVDLCANSATLASLAIGKRLVMTGTLATALAIADAGGSLWQVTPQIIGAGTIDVTGSVAGTAGQLKFSLHYVPIDAGASVTSTL